MTHNNLATDIQQCRYIDYDQFYDLCQKFNKNNTAKGEKDQGLSDDMIMGMFTLLDTDDSGELEPEEILGVL